MNEQKPGMLMPALIGGAVAGILSGIPVINCFCCLWIIGGAILAAYLLSKDSSVALQTGDGAIVGIFTGIIAAFVDFFVSMPFHALSNQFFRNFMERISQYAEEMPSGWERWFERGAFEASFAMSMLGLMISVFIFSALGALGGIIGISLFKKKPTQKVRGDPDAVQDSSHR